MNIFNSVDDINVAPITQLIAEQIFNVIVSDSSTSDLRKINFFKKNHTKINYIPNWGKGSQSISPIFLRLILKNEAPGHYVPPPWIYSKKSLISWTKLSNILYIVHIILLINK